MGSDIMTITLPLIPLFFFWIYFLGGDFMSEKFQFYYSIFSIVGEIAAIIISIYLATKTTNDKIRDTQDKIRDTQDKIETLQITCNEKFNNIDKKLGTENYKDRSLSLQHENICDMIENRSETEINVLNSYGEIITDINERNKKEAHQKEEREKFLTPEMLEINNVLAAVTNQNTLLNNMKVDLDNCRRELNQQKEKNTRLEEEIKRLKNAFDNDDFPDFTQVQGKGRR